MLSKSKMRAHEIGQSRPTWDVKGNTCLTCGRLVQKEEMVETYKTGCKVLVTCHGQEELRTFDFDTEGWNHIDLKRAMSRSRWFDPTKPREEAWGPLTEEQLRKPLGEDDDAV